MQAYEALSVDYFYIGELTKSQYYHERHFRGKMENAQSIVKKVTCNLLTSKYEQKHSEKDQRRGVDATKHKTELQRLPSPSALNKGAQVSKAISLLPNFTEAQS